MISFKKDIKPININDKLTLMENLLKAEVPVASSCDGEGICGMCRVRVLSGVENLSNKSNLEIDFFKNNNFDEIYRLSCQCQIKGSITVDTDYW